MQKRCETEQGKGQGTGDQGPGTRSRFRTTGNDSPRKEGSGAKGGCKKPSPLRRYGAALWGRCHAPTRFPAKQKRLKRVTEEVRNCKINKSRMANVAPLPSSRLQHFSFPAKLWGAMPPSPYSRACVAVAAGRAKLFLKLMTLPFMGKLSRANQRRGKSTT